MADGPLAVAPSTAANAVDIDNSLFGAGSTLYRQRVVIGDDANSSGFAGVTSGWPSSADFGLKVRIIGSSGIVLGSIAPSSNWSLGPSSANVIGVVAQSSNWNISTGTVVGLTTTSVVGLTTSSLVGLSSAFSNYVINGPSTEYIGALSSGSKPIGIVAISSGSSGAVIGQVAGSSSLSVTLQASSAIVVGSVAPSSAWTVTVSSGLAASTAAIGIAALQVWSTGDALVSVGYSTVQASTNLALPVRLSSGTAQFGALGPSSGTVIGQVAPSSAWSLGASSTLVIGLVGPSSAWSLGASSSIVIGSVAPSSNWSLGPSSATQIGIVSLSSGSSGTMLGIVALSSGSSGNAIGSVAPTSQWSLGPSSANVIGSVAPSSAWTIVTSTAAVLANYSSDAGTDPGVIAIIGGQVATTAPPATVASLKDQQLFLDAMGRLVTVGYPRTLAYSTFSNFGTTVENIMIAAATSWGAGVFLGITNLVVSNRSTDTPTEFWIQSSSGQATAVMKIALAPNGGAVMSFNPPWSPINSTQNWTGINTVVNTTVYVTAMVIPTL